MKKRIIKCVVAIVSVVAVRIGSMITATASEFNEKKNVTNNNKEKKLCLIG